MLIMILKATPLLIVPAVILGDVAAPSVTQGVLDVILGIIAGGLWKLITQINTLIKTIHVIKENDVIVRRRLDNHRKRIGALDGKDETFYED